MTAHREDVLADGRIRRLDAGWFVAYLVIAPDPVTATVQARIKAKLAHLQSIDVCRVDYQSDGEYVVELQVEVPEMSGAAE
jgi:hypothetical protein